MYVCMYPLRTSKPCIRYVSHMMLARIKQFSELI